MAVRAHCIIGESALSQLNASGLSSGWLKAWLLSTGVDSVSLYLMASPFWQQEAAQWRILIGSHGELFNAASQLGLPVEHGADWDFRIAGASSFSLDNPHRNCWHAIHSEENILLIPQGDMLFQRMLYLNRISGGSPLLPLAVYAGDCGELELDPGLSGTIVSEGEAPSGKLLNCNGQLPEEQLIETLRQKGLRFRCVESCSAGAIVARIGRVPGVSDVLERSWVCYSNASKSEEMGVPAALIEQCGAVSCEVASAMAEGGCSDDCVCISSTGIAGPGGGSAEKAVGTVWIAAALPGRKAVAELLQLSGSRHQVQQKAANAALALLLKLLNQ